MSERLGKTPGRNDNRAFSLFKKLAFSFKAIGILQGILSIRLI